MQVGQLNRLLDGMDPEATVYVMTRAAETGVPLLRAVEGISPAQSPAYGSAVIIEVEE